MHRLKLAGVRPGQLLELAASSDGVRIRSGSGHADLDEYVATHVFVAGAAAR